MSLFNQLWRRLFDMDSSSSKSRGQKRSHHTLRRRLGVQPLEDRRLLSVEPHGPEFQVNTYTTSGQSYSSIAVDSDGDFVVAWASYGQDSASSYGIYAQRYNSAGVAQGSEFRVNTTTADDQHKPSVAMDDAGNFVIAWQSENQDGSSYGVYAQRYNSSGTAQGSEFLVNTYTTGWQADASVAIDADGDFVIAWESYGDGSGLRINAQRYNSSGTAQGSEFQVNTYTTNDQVFPSAAMDDSGDFVIAWQSDGQDGSGYGVYAQRYNSSGTAQGSEFKVNTYTTSAQIDPDAAIDADGDFVIAWESSGQDGSNVGVYAQRYNASGTAQGSEFLVNTHTTNGQESPSVAVDSDGDFVIAWEAYGQDTANTWGVYAQRYNASGTAQESEFRVNTYTTGAQHDPDVAMESNGDFVVAWDSNGQDSGTSGIYAQRFVQAEFQVNTYTTGAQFGGSVGTDADGDFVVTWESDGQDGSSYGIYAQRYNSSGVAQGSEFRVNTYTTGQQTGSAVAMDADGDFVVVWTSVGQDGSYGGIYAQRYNASGTAQGSEFRVNTYTTGTQADPSVAMDDSGDFVIVWSGEGSGDNFGIFAQRYNSSGTAQGSEFKVNTNTTFSETGPSVAIDADGDFVIAWISYSGVGAQRYNASGTAQGSEFTVSGSHPTVAMDDDGDFVLVYDKNDGSSSGIYAQRYNASGTAQGSEFRVNTYTTGTQDFAVVAMDADGDFVVTWRSYGQDGSSLGAYGQRYNASGTTQGSEFRVNTYTTGSQNIPNVAMDADGDFVIGWTSDGQDGDSWGVYARRFG